MKHSRRSALQQSRTLSVGLDVQKDAIAVAYLAKAPHAAVVSLGHLGTRQGDIDTRVRQLRSKSQPRLFGYEAGPCGYWLSRALTQTGQVCWVLAPSWLPQKPGERVQTTRRDALTLARLMRSGALPPGSGPTGEAEAMRDLGRARAEALRARKPAQLRRKALLLRQALRDTGRATWGLAPLRWLREVVCPTPAPQSVFHADVRAVTEPTARLERFAPTRTDPGQPWRLRSVVDALQALRGVQFPVAVTAVAAGGALTRFANPRQLRSDRGGTPAAYSPGDRRPQGGLTKAGKSHARRALSEGAWASRSPAPVSRPLQLRLEKVPQSIQERRGKAQGRRWTRYRQRSARGKNAHPVVVAIACELRAFLWALARAVPLSPHRPRPLQVQQPCSRNFAWASAETQPRGGATRDGVKRRKQPRVPRTRQAPDGRQEGGTQSTASSRINRRRFLAPALPMDKVEEAKENASKSVTSS